MNDKFQRKPKRPAALWTTAFPLQHKALHPEREAAGGIKARGASETIRMEIYNAIRKLYLAVNPWCGAHADIRGEMGSFLSVFATQIHHKHGRDGNLLFDVRHWIGCCPECHSWIDTNRKEAVELGLLASTGEWRNEE